MARRVERAWKAVLRTLATVWGARAEIAVSLAILSGWALVTWAVASLLVWQVWPLSGGLFLLSLAGVKLLRRIAADGLYDLTRRARG